MGFEAGGNRNGLNFKIKILKPKAVSPPLWAVRPILLSQLRK